MTGTDSIYSSIGQAGVAYILLELVCIAAAWWVLQSVRWDIFLKSPSSRQAKLLQILLSVALGYQTAKFIIDYFSWSVMLKYLF